MVQLILILENLRSAYNVGSILRTADAAGVDKVVCVGSTPYPRLKNDTRDPVVINRNQREIAKSALGAEITVRPEHFDSSKEVISKLRAQGWTILALEQAPKSRNLLSFEAPAKTALVVGNEVSGVSTETLAAAEDAIFIPQLGAKESLNVAVAAGIAAYTLKSRDLANEDLK
jgi:23S rRNA (guanosine2251-2'-O)-methyltransferase